MKQLQSVKINPFSVGLKGLVVTGLLFQPMSALAELPPDQSAAADETVCYGVADNDRRDGSKDVLVKMYKSGTTVEVGSGVIKNTQTNAPTTDIEAVAFDIKGKTLYAVDGDVFGTLDLETAEFNPIGDGIGTASCNGEEIVLDDIDGLTFDFATGFLYATHRREHQTPQQYDVLVRLNPISGEVVKGAFGGEDCVFVKIDGYPQYYDVDDIASDPADSEIYLVANTGNGVESVLAKLNQTGGIDGSATFIGANNVDDIESLDFDKMKSPDGDGTIFPLFGTTGDGGYNKGDDPSARHRLYIIDKNTGNAAPSGELLPPSGEKQIDYEAVSCRVENFVPEINNCLMYAVHDEGRVDSQLLEIDPFASAGVGAIRPLGPLYLRRDLEGLALDPRTGKLYASSGSDQIDDEYLGKEIPDGAIYEVNRDTGVISMVGLTGYSEVSALGVRYSDPIEIWGWARGGDGKKTTAAGPITIDLPNSAAGTLIEEFPFRDPEIKAIAWSNDAQTLYASVEDGTYSDLMAYDVDTKKLRVQCDNVIKAEIEGMEIQPDNLLLFATHNRKDIGIVAYDPEKCEVVATRTFKDVKQFNDIESIEWPAKECNYRSWLYATSGDFEINLIEYDMVPKDVIEAVWQSIGGKDKEGNENISLVQVDAHVDIVYMYVDDEVYAVKPSLLGNGTYSVRGGRVTEAQMLPIDGSSCMQLSFGDEDGNQQVWKLCPIAVDEEALLNALNDVGNSAQIDEEGNVSVNVGGTVFKGQLSVIHQPAEYAPGESIPATVSDTATLQSVGDQAKPGEEKGDGVADILITYPNFWQQVLFLTK
jgi:hypothetical protein